MMIILQCCWRRDIAYVVSRLSWAEWAGGKTKQSVQNMGPPMNQAVSDHAHKHKYDTPLAFLE